LACIFLLLLWLIVSYALAYVSIHPAKLKNHRTPASLNLSYENVAFSSTDGVRLAGWFIPAKDSRAVIIACHGYSANRSMLLDHIAFLHRAGFNVLTFDFRALGESEGEICSIGYHEVKDALGAVAYLQQREDTRHSPVGILGTSMGGAVALMATAQSPDIRAVVADSPYASLDRAVTQRFRGFVGFAGGALSLPTCWFGERMLGANTVTVSPLQQVSQISPRPLLLIHGTNDRRILPEDSQLLFAAAAEPKELWLIQGARHIQGHRIAGQAYERRVITFFEKAFSMSQ
jgi:fermentation-respiration switch protein FrsA (DUF1100 family)